MGDFQRLQHLHQKCSFENVFQLANKIELFACALNWNAESFGELGKEE